MSELRSGEEIVHSAGGRCVVCKQKIEPGRAVQLSKWTSNIRHLECMPKTDSRHKRSHVKHKANHGRLEQISGEES